MRTFETAFFISSLQSRFNDLARTAPFFFGGTFAYRWTRRVCPLNCLLLHVAIVATIAASVGLSAARVVSQRLSTSVRSNTSRSASTSLLAVCGHTDCNICNDNKCRLIGRLFRFYTLFNGIRGIDPLLHWHSILDDNKYRSTRKNVGSVHFFSTYATVMISFFVTRFVTFLIIINTVFFRRLFYWSPTLFWSIQDIHLLQLLMMEVRFYLLHRSPVISSYLY